MHEAFQRLILNFLVTNRTEAFMDVEKHDIPRKLGPGGSRMTKDPFEMSSGLSSEPGVSARCTVPVKSFIPLTLVSLPIAEQETTYRVAIGKGLPDAI